MAEFLTVVVLFVAAPWVVFTGVAKLRRAGRHDGESLRQSDLHALIRDAVDRAVQPLERRIETLEAIVTDEDPAAVPRDAAALADLLDTDDPAESVAVRRRTRA